MRSGKYAAIATMSAVLIGVSVAAVGSTGAAAVTVPVITTIAGGDGGPGPGTSVAVSACAVSTGFGETYLAGNGVVWNLNQSTGWLQPVAGVGGISSGNAANGVPALTAGLSGACGTANDSHGNLVIATPTNEVRVVARQSGTYYGQAMTAGRIYTIAGTGEAGFAGDGGPAVRALLTHPEGVSLDSSGNVIISDTGNSRVRVVAEKTGTFYGHSMQAGDIYTVLANSGVHDTLTDKWGNLVGFTGSQVWVYAEKTGTYYGRSMSGGNLYTIAIAANLGTGTIDYAGNVLFSGKSLVTAIAASTGTFYGQSMTAGQTYTIAGGGTLTGNGVPALQAAIGPTTLTSQSSGALVIGEGRDVRVVPLTTGSYYGHPMTGGNIYTVAGNGFLYSGDGGPATRAVLGAGDSVPDASGNILILGRGVVRCLAEQTGTFYAQKMTKGDIYTIYHQPPITVSTPDVYRLAVDPSGNLVFAAKYGDQDHVAILAEHTGTYYGLPMTAGTVYTVYVDPTAGGLASVWPDHQGNLLITRLDTGRVYVLAGHSGVVYGHYLTAGKSRLLAGGGPAPVQNGIPATQAYLAGPVDTVVSPSGDLLITDESANLVRVVAEKSETIFGQQMRAGYIYTVAGDGLTGPATNNIPGVKAALFRPQGAAADAAGNLVIADTWHNQIRVVATKTGTFYGQSMKAGYIYLLAGTGKNAYGGDGGPASKAWLSAVHTLMPLPSGAILVPAYNRLRLITP